MTYPWGDESPVCRAGAENGAKFDDDAGCDGTDTEPVGNFSANGYDLYDMAGNVWEWVADWYDADYYGSSPYENPQGPSSGSYRVLRGGSWYDNPGNLSVAARIFAVPDFKGIHFVGFRCARSP
jgi:formylglycine-generating enzyme required for sulfatase activity